MSTLPSLLRSIVISGVFSFVLPCIAIGFIACALYGLGLSPITAAVGEAGLQQMAYILRTFGNGDAVTGLVLISGVCCLVGVLFDVFAFYRQQKLGSN